MTMGAVVRSVGIRSPLGFDAVGNAMAARADLLDVDASPFLGTDGTPLGVARNRSLPDDLYGQPRLARLAAPALREAAPSSSGALPLILALPARHAEGPDADAEILRELQMTSSVRIDLSRSEVVRGGNAAGALVVARALEVLRRGDTDVLIGGVDSYFHPDVLRRLDAQGRVLRIEGGDGMIPGEAAAFACVGSRGTETLARVVEVHHAVDRRVAAQQPNLGEETTRIARTLIQARGGSVGWVVTDDDGRDRSEEWAWTTVREPGLRDAAHFAIPRLFGDVGAATGVLALAIACAWWSAGCAPAGDALVMLRDDDGTRGGFLLESMQ
jgi:3-oxoacyl-[acyl-carrier-protein] synthase I